MCIRDIRGRECCGRNFRRNHRGNGRGSYRRKCGGTDSVSYTHLDVYKRQGIETTAAVDSGVCIVAEQAGVIERSTSKEIVEAY